MTAWTRVRVTAGIIVVVLGSMSILTGMASTGIVASIVSLVGRTGVVQQPLGTVTTDPAGTAIIIDGVEASVSAGSLPDSVRDLLALAGSSPERLLEDQGELVLVGTPRAEGDAFLGTASPGDVDDYLFGHPYSVAERMGTDWPTINVPGDGQPASPAEQSFWEAKATGSPVEIPASGLGGLTLVAMNTDSNPGVALDLRLEYRVPDAPLAIESSAITAAAACVGGLLLVLLGAWLVVGPRGRGRHA